ncbi:MAG: mandelate racemase/muconate lactonizing enzyme family protein, partial [Candidatus Acidiferrum sp.]
AFLDAYGRHFGDSLAKVAQLLAPEIYEAKDHVRYSGAITSARGFKARLAAWAMRIYGFRQVKVKVGMAGYDDAARLRIIRGRVGENLDLRVDANEAWSLEQAVKCIRDLEEFSISSVEQPLSHSSAAVLPELRRAVTVPIMLDESLCGQVDAERAIAGQWCDLFNIRLSKCGGFIPSLRLVQRAYQHGLGCQLGCQVGESAILSAAGRHFACAVVGLRYLEGSYDRHLVRQALGTRDLTFGWGGRAPALAGAGLGVEVDPVALERVTIKKERLILRLENCGQIARMKHGIVFH